MPYSASGASNDRSAQPMSDSTTPDLTPRIAALILAFCVAATCTGALRYLRPGVPFGNDLSSHYAEITFIAKVLQSGETDFWFDQVNLGYPLFLAYPPLPSLLMGSLTGLTSWFLPGELLFKLSIVLLWALMPVAWYRGGRWFGRSRIEAIALGLLALAVRDAWSFGLGLASFSGTGLYSQLWGMVLLPLLLGSMFRLLVEDEPGLKRPALILLLTILSQLYFAYYCVVAGAVMLMARRGRTLLRLSAAAKVYGTALALAAFWIIPFLVYGKYQGGLPWRHENENGYPLSQLARFAIEGDFFDHGRAPWLSALVAVGLVMVAVHRRGRFERWLLALTAVSAVLMLGSTNIGAFYWIAHLGQEPEVIRYLIGLHFCGLLLAAYVVGRVSQTLLKNAPPRTVTIVVTLVCCIYILQLPGVVRRSLKTFDDRSAQFRQIASSLARGGPSRYLAHKRLGTASHFHLNHLANISRRPQMESFSRGYHDTLSLFYLEGFDFSAPAFRLFGVGALVARRGHRIPSDAPMREALATREYRVLELTQPPRLFEFVHTPVTIEGELKAMRATVQAVTLPLFERGLLPVLSVSSDKAQVRLRATGEPEILIDALARTPPPSVVGLTARLRDRRVESSILSEVTEERVALNEYEADVLARGSGERLLLKVSYHPRWQAFVDDREVPVVHSAPNLMVVDVPAGRHRIRFRYTNPPYQKLLFCGSIVAVAGWLVAPRRRRPGARLPPASPGGGPDFQEHSKKSK